MTNVLGKLEAKTCVEAHYSDRCDKLEAELVFLKNLLKVATCPNAQCQNGVICTSDGSEGGSSQEECQWCYLKEEALKGGK